MFIPASASWKSVGEHDENDLADGLKRIRLHCVAPFASRQLRPSSQVALSRMQGPFVQAVNIFALQNYYFPSKLLGRLFKGGQNVDT